MSAAARVHLYSDGACSGNPGPGGWAVLLCYGKHERLLSGAERDTTNNRMELLAAIHGLEALTRRSHVVAHTDSQYVQRGIEEWVARWKANGWRTADRKPVRNQDLWERLEQAVRAHEVQWRWVRGHSGHPENERVDAAARAAIAALNEH
jgi:ribonuclease HI